MTKDATFEDGGDRPLNLGAFDDDDLKIVSALVQDAVFPATEMSWRADERRFAILLNRFRWEDADVAARRKRAVERVQTLLVVDNVMSVSSMGIDRTDKDTVLSLMSLSFEPGDAPSGMLHMILAGDGEIRISVEALEVSVRDVTRPYIAPSGATPDHPA